MTTKALILWTYLLFAVGAAIADQNHGENFVKAYIVDVLFWPAATGYYISHQMNLP